MSQRTKSVFKKTLQVVETVSKQVPNQPRFSELSEGKSRFLSINKESCANSGPSDLNLEAYWLIKTSNALFCQKHQEWKQFLPFFFI